MAKVRFDRWAGSIRPVRSLFHSSNAQIKAMGARSAQRGIESSAISQMSREGDVSYSCSSEEGGWYPQKAQRPSESFSPHSGHRVTGIRIHLRPWPGPPFRNVFPS